VTGSVTLSVFLFALLRIIIVDSRLRGIRLQQFYGLISVLYWYLVLLMSAVAKVVPKKSWMAAILFTRRAFGAMVAYFALLHALVALFDQLDGLGGIGLLPLIFRWSLALGAISLVVLLIMAALSVDKFVGLVKFKAWKQLSRISYVAGALVIVHVWLIGTHAAPILMQLIGFEALVMLAGFEAWRIGKALAGKGVRPARAAVVAVGIWVVVTGSLLGMRQLLPSYSKDHQEHIAGTGIHAH
jgi:DMSO/TMAO reductase YedYZ heme-binding membrane subunit